MVATTVQRNDKGQFEAAPRPPLALGPQIAPHGLIVATIAVANAGWLLSHGVSTAPIAVALLIVTGVASFVMLRRRLAAGKTNHYRYATTLAATAWVWAVAWVALGPNWQLLAVGVCAGFLAATPWWRAHRLPNPDPDAVEAAPIVIDVEPEIEPERDIDEPSALERDWDNHVTVKGGPLPGARLSDIAEEEHITRARLDLVRGRQTVDTAVAAIPLMASGLQTRADKIIIEDHPDLSDAAVAQMTVVTGTPIGDVVDYTGNAYNPATGCIAMGPYIDGAGWAEWELYGDNSMWGGFIAAGIGMGKSRLIDVLAHAAMSSGHTTVWYCDPQGGASSPALAEAADWTARSLTAIIEMLQSLRGIMRYREAYNVVHGLTGFTPTPAMPGLMVIIDEAHMALADATIHALVAEIASIGRKLGICFIMASQQADLSTFGGAGSGNSERIRNNISHNIVFLRTTTKNTGNLIGGVTVDPSTLPKIPGYAYQAAAEEGGTGRNAAFRAAHLGDADDAPLQWFNSIPTHIRATLDPASTNAAGATYRDRHTRAEVDLDAMRAIVAAANAGLDLPELNPTPPSTPHDHGYGDITFPAWDDYDTTGPTFNVELTDAQRRILNLITTGTAKKRDLEHATGWSETYVRQRLNELVDHHLIKPMFNDRGNRTGFYRLTQPQSGQTHASETINEERDRD